MTEQEVISVFSEVVRDNELMKSIEATKHQRYEWRHLERGNVKLATMLEVLFKLNLLEFKKKDLTDSDKSITMANGVVLRTIEVDAENAGRGNSEFPNQEGFTHKMWLNNKGKLFKDEFINKNEPTGTQK